jgi:ABC-type nitrate/sulfonate/bicarbonate transport system permease component
MVNAAGKYQVDVVFAGLIIFMVLSLVMTSFVKALEDRLGRWRPEKVKTF